MEAGTQFIGIKPEINMAERKSNVANNPTDVFTIEEIANVSRPYKVYTALLTQSGGDGNSFIGPGELTIGVTYMINDYFLGQDFTNVGAPNNDVGTWFVATGTTPNNWGLNQENGLIYYPGAPVVVTVLENTVGNVFFGIEETGSYALLSDNLFNDGRTIGFITFNDNGTYSLTDKPSMAITQGNTNRVYITTALDGLYSSDVLYNTPIEIRVYPEPEAQ